MNRRPIRTRSTPLLPRRIPLRYRARWAIESLYLKMPWVANEGEATARVVDRCFAGYPMADDFASKEEAVALLAAIWDVVDNWDGSRINVRWDKEGFNVREWATGKTPEGVTPA